MANPEAFADNFEAREKRFGEEFNQELTVFKSSIREDQKVGLELVPGTWVEFMIVHPPAITLEVRVAHREYWVLSRQTLTSTADNSSSGAKTYRPFLSAEESRKLLSVYSDQVARTRSILDALIAR